MQLPFEHFPPLSAIGICRHAFTRRISGINVSADKSEVLKRLDAAHREIRNSVGLGEWPLFTAQQVHGDRIAVVDGPALALRADRTTTSNEFLRCDGIISDQRGVVLGVYVADCCAVYIVDTKTPAIGLVHSGRKGTELNIVQKAIAQMVDCFGTDSADLVVQLSPCVRPPHYELDFAAEIVRQCRASGVKKIHDCGICTACDLNHYYSYRAEKGKTGRMLALLAIKPKAIAS
jgi:copper oxidase (laccase) domain-containing protein